MIDSLLDTVRRDRFNADEWPDNRFVAGWNAHADHVLRVLRGLRELAEAEPIDLRLKAELTGLPQDWPSAHELFDYGGES